MKGATLFSGIGAPECAAPFIDWRWSAEIDDFASAVHAHRFPSIPNLGDVTKLKGQDIERPDVIVFGSPCQSFSVAGKRLGLGDPRGNLALIALRLVAELRPRWFVFENVPGLLSSADGEDFAAFLRAVRQCGYTGAYRVLDAQHFGVPQRRRRVFFVGHLGDDWRPSAAVLFEPESLSGHPPPGREAGEDVAASLAVRSGGGGHPDGGDGRHSHLIPTWPAEIAPTLNAHYGDKQGLEDQHALGGAGHFVPFDTTQVTSKGNYSNPKPGDPCHPLAAGAHAPAVAFNHQSGGDFRPMANENMANALQRCQGQAVADGAMVRRLTPTECERLQGFPDGFTDIPWRGKPAPDGRRYKALGNSMAVPVLRWILERLWIVDRETSPHHTRRQNPGASAGAPPGRRPRPGGGVPSRLRADLQPFILPEGHVQIAFSGGRTSGMMLHHILEANGGLPDRAKVIFTNTGREMPETLDFVQECGERWGVEIIWAEYRARLSGNALEHDYTTVTPDTASRNGEPLIDIMRKFEAVPNRMARFCSTQCKERTAKRYLMDCGWGHWTIALGIRADEQRRIATKPPKDRFRFWYPMNEAGLAKRDVSAFWARQPFDLRLANIEGKTPLGNCDGCFLKSEANRAMLARDYPERARWWAKQEARFGKTFLPDQTWEQLQRFVDAQGDFLFSTEGALCQADDGECVG